MHTPSAPRRPAAGASTRAVVQRVLPRFGLADLVGTDDRLWAVTRGTAGPGLEALAPGVEVELELLAVSDGLVVAGYRLTVTTPPADHDGP